MAVDAYCLERFGASVEAERALSAIEHGFTHVRLTITPQPVRVVRWDESAHEPGTLWLPLADVGPAALPAPIKKLLVAIAGRKSDAGRTLELLLQPQ
jgi:A/G-specific adenine glycosylase